MYFRQCPLPKSYNPKSAKKSLDCVGDTSGAFSLLDAAGLGLGLSKRVKSGIMARLVIFVFFNVRGDANLVGVGGGVLLLKDISLMPESGAYFL